VWFKDAHNLMHGQSWSTDALGTFAQRLSEASHRARTRLLFESRRRLPIESQAGREVQRHRVEGLEKADGVALLRRELLRVELGSALGQESLEGIWATLRGHPAMLAIAVRGFDSKDGTGLVEQLKKRGGTMGTIVAEWLNRLKLSPAESKVLAALLQCRRAVTVSALLGLDQDLGQTLQCLSEAGLIVSAADHVETEPLVRLVPESALPLAQEDVAPFHLRASEAFESEALLARGAEYIRAAQEANYHAALAGRRAPFDTRGVFDGVAGAAQRAYTDGRYSEVIRLLEGLIKLHIDSVLGAREDLVRVLCEAYAWDNQLEKAFELSARLVGRHPSSAVVYISIGKAALRSHRLEDVQRALAEGGPNLQKSSHFYLLAGRYHEVARSPATHAVEAFQKAIDVDKTNGWAYFHLARALVRFGKLEEAFEVIDQGRSIVEKWSGGGALRLEHALMQEEMKALVQSGDLEHASKIAEFLTRAHEPAVEVIVYSAYVRAMLTKAGAPNVDAFEHAIDRLKGSKTSHDRAKIHLLRGKLYELVGRPTDAEREFEFACNEDPYDMHMLKCHADAIEDLLSRNPGPRVVALQEKLSRVNAAMAALKE
jgi:tetratricopeptide (TPR) repeat protein